VIGEKLVPLPKCSLNIPRWLS